MSWIVPYISFVAGMIVGVIIYRLGIKTGARIVYKTKENLPAFGRGDEDVEIVQTHAGQTDFVEELEE